MFQRRLPTDAEVSTWMGLNPDALCIVCGAVSGNLEMIDFDCAGEAFEAWRSMVEEIEPGLVDRLYVESTPSGGRHVVYRCESPVCGNTKLAQRRDVVDGEAAVEVAGKTLTPRRGPDGAWSVAVTLIETRGEGGMFLCAPSPGYEAIAGSLNDPPKVSAEEREVLLGCAWRLDHAVPDVAGAPPRAPGPHLRPGDDYNAG